MGPKHWQHAATYICAYFSLCLFLHCKMLQAHWYAQLQSQSRQYSRGPGFSYWRPVSETKVWVLGPVFYVRHRASLVAQMVKNPAVVQEAQVQSLGQEDALEKGMATHARILAWRILWCGDINNMVHIRLSHPTFSRPLPPCSVNNDFAQLCNS